MRVMLIIPPRIKSRHRDFALYYSNPHIGMAYLAAALREKGHSVKMIDAQAQERSFGDLQTQVTAFSPELVGITVYTEQIEEAGNAARGIKSWNPAVPIIIGGCQASKLPRETLEKFPHFDQVIRGESEDQDRNWPVERVVLGHKDRRVSDGG